jgi:putative ABC transport system permease protein
VAFRRGPNPLSQKSGLRRILVVFQFVVAVALTSVTLVVVKQVDFAENKDLGFDLRGLVVLENHDRAQAPKTAVVRNEILAKTGARAAALLDSLPSSQNRNIRTVRAENKAADEETMVQSIEADAAFVPAMGLEVLRGRNFEEGRAGDEESALINEKAALALGFEDPLGHVLSSGGRAFRIVGVLKDWHTNSIHSPIYPTVLFPADESASTLVVRLAPGAEARTLEEIRGVWERVLPGQMFEYAFVDDVIDEAYGKERRLAEFLVFFCLLTVFVACLGVFGLASFTAEQRTKEIGIRKILGAETPGIVALLVRSFTGWVIIGWAVAVPIAVYAAGRWLRGYTYRTTLGPGPFLAAGLLALTVALLSVIFQAVRAASADPVDALRYE